MSKFVLKIENKNKNEKYNPKVWNFASSFFHCF